MRSTSAFPFIKVEILRAPGGQLLQRVKTEAAAGKLLADVIDHSDRALMLAIENCSRTTRRRMPPTTCPRRASRQAVAALTVVWAIAYNTELVKNPPKSWMDLPSPNTATSRSGR